MLCESCGHQSNTFAENCSLTLQIPRLKKAELSLDDCLNYLVKVDKLCGDNKYSCDGCKKKVNAYKTSSIDTFPRILIIDFVRYNLGRKNSEIIKYPETLSLDRYTSRAIDHSHAKKLNLNSKKLGMSSQSAQ